MSANLSIHVPQDRDESTGASGGTPMTFDPATEDVVLLRVEGHEWTATPDPAFAPPSCYPAFVCLLVAGLLLIAARVRVTVTRGRKSK